MKLRRKWICGGSVLEKGQQEKGLDLGVCLKCSRTRKEGDGLEERVQVGSDRM